MLSRNVKNMNVKMKTLGSPTSCPLIVGGVKGGIKRPITTTMSGKIRYIQPLFFDGLDIFLFLTPLHFLIVVLKSFNFFCQALHLYWLI